MHHQDLLRECKEFHLPKIEKVLVSCVSRTSAHMEVAPVIPVIDFDLRGIRRAAMAYPPTHLLPGGLISFNPLFFRNPDHVREQVEYSTPHEYAHIVCMQLFPEEKGHGRMWKSIMRFLGVPAVRTHNMVIPEAEQVETITYRCPSCGLVEQFSRRRHNNVLLRGKRYYHIQCLKAFVQA